MARKIATNTTVDLTGLLDFVRPRHKMILATVRADGTPQLSPVTGGVDEQGRIVIATYPGRAKTVNAGRAGQVAAADHPGALGPDRHRRFPGGDRPAPGRPDLTRRRVRVPW